MGVAVVLSSDTAAHTKFVRHVVTPDCKLKDANLKSVRAICTFHITTSSKPSQRSRCLNMRTVCRIPTHVHRIVLIHKYVFKKDHSRTFFFKITWNHLPPLSRDVLDKLTVPQAVQKFLVFFTCLYPKTGLYSPKPPHPTILFKIPCNILPFTPRSSTWPLSSAKMTPRLKVSVAVRSDIR